MPPPQPIYAAIWDLNPVTIQNFQQNMLLCKFNNLLLSKPTKFQPFSIHKAYNYPVSLSAPKLFDLHNQNIP